MSAPEDPDIESYFERYGWTCERVDTHTFRTGFRGDNGSFAAMVRVTDHWVVFTINPYLRPPDGGWGLASLRTLALANQTINMAKLGIDEEGDVFLTVELPSEGFTYSHFSDAMTTVTHFADGFIVPLLQARAIDERAR